MGLFSHFTRTDTPSPMVFFLSYWFCFQGLPRIFFANPAAVISAFEKDGAVALQAYVSTFLEEYVKVRPASRSCIPAGFASMFSIEVRRVDANISVALITHPRPPKFPIEIQPGKPLLAPYFVAIVFDPSSVRKPVFFVLSQNLKGGSTLRSVSSENSHGTCAACCKPSLEDFLSLITLVQRDGIHAARKKYPCVY